MYCKGQRKQLRMEGLVLTGGGTVWNSTEIDWGKNSMDGDVVRFNFVSRKMNLITYSFCDVLMMGQSSLRKTEKLLREISHPQKLSRIERHS